jgi:type II secretory pathway predicted ATPase ExeA
MTELTDSFTPTIPVFGVRRKPFSSAETEFYCTTINHLDAYIRLLQGIRQPGNLTVLTGESGTGKTLLLRKVVREIPAQIQSVFCYSTNLDFDTLLTVICDQLGLVTQGLDQSAKLESLKEYVRARRAQGMDVTLIIDEAHNLGKDGFDRLLTLVHSDPPEGCPMPLVLSGMPALEDILAQQQATHPQVVNAVHLRLDRLADAEVEVFIQRQMQSAGGLPAETLFPTPVIERIARYAQGIPRLINRLCDRILVGAQLARQSALSTELVDEAASQLLLPEPAGVGDSTGAPLPGVQAANPPPSGPQATPSLEALTRKRAARGTPLNRALLRNQNPAQAPERVELVSRPFIVCGRYNESSQKGFGDFSLGFLAGYGGISRLHCAVCACEEGLAVMHTGRSNYSYTAINGNRLPRGQWQRLETGDILNITGLYEMQVVLVRDVTPGKVGADEASPGKEQFGNWVLAIVDLLDQLQQGSKDPAVRQHLKTSYTHLAHLQNQAAGRNGVNNPGPLLYARFQREGADRRQVTHIYLPKWLSIGSSQQAGLRIDAQGVAPEQAKLLFKEGLYWIQNCAGHGEVRVGNHDLAPDETIPLEQGDEIALGTARFVFERY